MPRRLMSTAVLCFFAFLSITCARKGPEGHWRGCIFDGKQKLRVALEVSRDAKGGIAGGLSRLDDGVYDQPLERVSFKDGVFHFEFTGDKKVRETADLRMDWGGRVLDGTTKTAGKARDWVLSRETDPWITWFSKKKKEPLAYSYRVPQTAGDGWETDDLRLGGKDLKILETGINRILDGTFPLVRGMVVARHGKLVLDETFAGDGPADSHRLISATKSVFSLLFGIASDGGLLRPEEKLYDYFPEYRVREGWQKDKDKITLGSILSMTSGLDCDDNDPAKACAEDFYNSGDWLNFSLSLSLAREPGSSFAYSNAALVPLGAVLARKTGASVPVFAREKLFDPLGIPPQRWDSGPGFVADIAGGLWMRPRDMARLGCLVSGKGMWKGKRILSEEWVKRATTARANVEGANIMGNWQYGYLWWLGRVSLHGKNLKLIAALGAGGQCILVVPELDLVAAVTGDNFLDSTAAFINKDFFEQYILNGLY